MADSKVGKELNVRSLWPVRDFNASMIRRMSLVLSSAANTILLLHPPAEDDYQVTRLTNNSHFL